MKVIKRNGDRVEFDINKIKISIQKASKRVKAKKDRISREELNSICNEVNTKLANNTRAIKAGVIQDCIENTLIEHNAHEVVKEYICYRYLHKLARDSYSELMAEISNKLNGKDIQNQNANVDEASFGGRIGEAASLMDKRFALEFCMSDMARENHLNNEIYIHDLDSYAVGNHNCLSIPFDKLLANGFNTRQTDVRPAGGANTAFQLLAVIFQLQSLQQFGGVSSTHLDWTMVPYVRKSFVKHWRDGYHYIAKANDELDWEYLKTFSIDSRQFSEKFPDVYKYAMDMTIKEVYQSVEAMYHNLNTLQSRSGNQLPFTSINYGTCTLTEGRMVTKALLDVSIEGLGSLRRTSIFPCGIFQYMKGVNDRPGTPNYDLYKLALKSTAQRLYPNYANCDWSGNKGYDRNDPKTYFSTMGKRKLQLI